MMSTLVTNIGELTTNTEEDGSRIHSAAVILEDDRIAWVGAANAAPPADRCYDAEGRAALPGWVDSHTHMVFAGDRSAEFEARMEGATYAAGGINRTVEATRAASDTDLLINLSRLLFEARKGGTTTIETKTGYGLTVADEKRSAHIASQLVDEVTFLGAHVVPEGADRDTYLELVTGDMLAAVKPYVTAVDVFCEAGAFTMDESASVLKAALANGLNIHVHGNQLGPGDGARLAVEYSALSVDHVGFLSDGDVDALADSWSEGEDGTVATVLPACDLSTRMPFAPARRLIDAGVTLAIASNCNPGTSYTSSMGFSVATAVLQMGLTVEEAVRAATLGGAIALNRHRERTGRSGKTLPPVGMVSVGARADLQLLNAPSISHLAYRPGMPLTHAVWCAGSGPLGE